MIKIVNRLATQKVFRPITPGLDQVKTKRKKFANEAKAKAQLKRGSPQVKTSVSIGIECQAAAAP